MFFKGEISPKPSVCDVLAEVPPQFLGSCREPAYCILSAAFSTASSFRIWNSSTGILSLPGASVRSSTRDKGHEEGGSAYARRDRASGVPLEILEHLPPKPESAYFLLCALTYTSDFMGGCPPLPVSEKKLTYSSS